MRISDILHPEWVKAPLIASTKQDAINAMIDLLADHGGVTSRDEMKAAVWQREQTRTTGIGQGVAIPHGKCDCCKTLCVAVAKLEKPIDFGAIDGRPVDLVFLLGSPKDQAGPHIQALASISRMLTEPEFRRAIRAANSSESLYKAILDHEAKMVAT